MEGLNWAVWEGLDSGRWAFLLYVLVLAFSSEGSRQYSQKEKRKISDRPQY